MTASTLFLLLLVLACPLMMMLMMRGGHGHGEHGGGHHSHGEDTGADVPTADLRRRRDDLDQLIEEREQREFEERKPPLASHGGRR